MRLALKGMMWWMIALIAVGLLGALVNAPFGLPRETVAGWGIGLVMVTALVRGVYARFKYRQQARTQVPQAADSTSSDFMPDPVIDPIDCEVIDDLTDRHAP